MIVKTASTIRLVQGAIETQGLEVRYDDVVALAAVDVSVPHGASLAVVGANGSGKSTFLGALAGTHTVSGGSVAVDGEPPALVLQATDVDDSLPITVHDAVKLGRYPTVGLFRRFRRADTEAVATALKRMGVAHLANARLNGISGGQRQRVLVAQGLAQQSPVLLLDEPMTGLDMTARQLVLDAVEEETAAGRTVVMTTHSLTDAATCDLVLLLRTKPIAYGAPGAVLTEPNLRSAFGHHVVRLGQDLMIDDHHVH